jgi:hypothetical protein
MISSITFPFLRRVRTGPGKKDTVTLLEFVLSGLTLKKSVDLTRMLIDSPQSVKYTRRIHEQIRYLEMSLSTVSIQKADILAKS